LIPVAAGAGADRPRVRPRAGLGDREARLPLAGDRRTQVGVLLGLVRVVEDVVGASREDEREEAAAELDLDQRRRHGGQAHAAVCLGRLDPEEPRLLRDILEAAQLLDGQPALATAFAGQRVGLEGEELPGDEGANPGADLLLVVAQGEVDHAHSFVGPVGAANAIMRHGHVGGCRGAAVVVRGVGADRGAFVQRLLAAGAGGGCRGLRSAASAPRHDHPFRGAARDRPARVAGARLCSALVAGEVAERVGSGSGSRRTGTR
jgi:hypothetical protein